MEKAPQQDNTNAKNDSSKSIFGPEPPSKSALFWGSVLSISSGVVALIINTGSIPLVLYWGIASIAIGVFGLLLKSSSLKILPTVLLAFLQPLLWPAIAILDTNNRILSLTFALLLLLAWFPILNRLLSIRKHQRLNTILIVYNSLIGGICLYLIVKDYDIEINTWETERILLLSLILMMILSNWLHNKNESWRQRKLKRLSENIIEEFSQSKEHFESLVANLQNTFFLQFNLFEKSEVRYTYFSTNGKAHFGITLEDLQKQPDAFFELLHPEDRAQFISAVQSAFEKQSSIEHVARYRYSSGNYNWTKFIYQPHDSANNFSTYNVMMQDIHENFLLEERIRESQQFLHRLTSSLPDALFSIEYNSGSPIFLTGHYLRLLGYSSSELRSMENFPQPLIPEEHLTDFSNFWRRIEFKFGQIHEIEIPLTKKDGSLAWFLLRTSLLKINSQHQPLHLLMILTNIEQRKETENELRKSEESYERAVNGTNDGIWEWHMDTGDFIVSDRFLSNLGVARMDWENSVDFWESLIEKEHRDLFWNHLNEQTEEHKKIDIEIKVFHKIFGFRWYHLRGSSLQSDKNNLIISGSLRDINSLKMDRLALKDSKEALENLTDELKTRNQQLENYADITSHNLRSPISNILSLTEIVPLEKDPDQLKLLMDKMKQTANNLNSTLYDLHKVLKIKRTADLSKDEVEFERIFNQVRDSSMHLIMETSAEILGDFSKAPTIVYHQPYLESIILNLITNSIKYRADDRPPIVFIETQLSGNDIVLTCKDNGLGIDLPKHGHKIFGLHKTFHRKKDSRGVGLFMTRNQIESQGGTISVKSVIGEGSTFTIRF